MMSTPPSRPDSRRRSERSSRDSAAARRADLATSSAVPDGERVRPAAGVGQPVGGEGQTVQGLGDGVVHLAGQSCAFVLDGDADSEAGPGLGQRLAGRADAEHQVAQRDTDRTGEDAEAREQQGAGQASTELLVGAVGGGQDQDLDHGEDAGRPPAVEQSCEQRGADDRVAEGRVRCGGEQEQGAEDGVGSQQERGAYEEWSEAFPVAVEGVRADEGDEDGGGDEPAREAGGGVVEGLRGADGDHGQAEEEHLAGQRREGVDLDGHGGCRAGGRGQGGVPRVLGTRVQGDRHGRPLTPL